MPFPNAKRGRRSRGSSLCTRTRARVPRECGIRERAAEPEREREREKGGSVVVSRAVSRR